MICKTNRTYSLQVSYSTTCKGLEPVSTGKLNHAETYHSDERMGVALLSVIIGTWYVVVIAIQGLLEALYAVRYIIFVVGTFVDSFCVDFRGCVHCIHSQGGRALYGYCMINQVHKGQIDFIWRNHNLLLLPTQYTDYSYLFMPFSALVTVSTILEPKGFCCKPEQTGHSSFAKSPPLSMPIHVKHNSIFNLKDKLI